MTCNFQRNFSHLYIENSVFDDPEVAQLREKFSSATLVPINCYKEVFNPKHQNWREQKLSQKLIIAKRKNNFLYKGSNVAPNFGNTNFFYTAPALNCMYDCSYCYLQGMYSSANLVLFVNHLDYFNEVDLMLEKLKSMYLCVSYDTDLLALETIVPYCRNWINFASTRPNLKIELRSKSSNFHALMDLEATSNVILAWTLSPEFVQTKYEPKTPSLKARTNAVKDAIRKGWKVRICLDPLIYIPDQPDLYSTFIADLARQIDLTKIHDLYLGVFRMNEDYLKKIQKLRTDTDVLYQPHEKIGKLTTYTNDLREKLSKTVLSALEKNGVPNESVYFHDMAMN